MRRYVVVGLLLSLLAAGCHEREPSPLEPQGNAPPLPVPYQIATPNTIRAPEEVVEAANQINAYAAVMLPYVSLAETSRPQPTDSGWVWQFDMGGLLGKLIATRRGDTTFWEVRLSGSNGYMSYHNTLILRGETSPRHQRWVRYNEEIGKPSTKVLVQKQTSGKVTVEVQATNLACLYRATVDPDSTTQVECLQNNAVTFQALWKPGKSGRLVRTEAGKPASTVTWKE